MAVSRQKSAMPSRRLLADVSSLRLWKLIQFRNPKSNPQEEILSVT